MIMYESDDQNRLCDLNEILDRMDALPVLDLRRPEEIIGYDAKGLPD